MGKEIKKIKEEELKDVNGGTPAPGSCHGKNRPYLKNPGEEDDNELRANYDVLK